jgi:hypothetical protein
MYSSDVFWHSKLTQKWLRVVHPNKTLSAPDFTGAFATAALFAADDFFATADLSEASTPVFGLCSVDAGTPLSIGFGGVAGGLGAASLTDGDAVLCPFANGRCTLLLFERPTVDAGS